MTSTVNAVLDAIETPKGITVAMARLAEKLLGTCDTALEVCMRVDAGDYSDEFMIYKASAYAAMLEGRTLAADRIPTAMKIAYQTANLTYLVDLANERTK